MTTVSYIIYDRDGFIVRTGTLPNSDHVLSTFIIYKNPFNPLEAPMLMSDGTWSGTVDGRSDTRDSGRGDRPKEPRCVTPTGFH